MLHRFSRGTFMKINPAAFLLALIFLLPGCAATGGGEGAASPPAQSLTFLDVPKFDRDLSASLASPFEAVDVGFYDRVSPNDMPQRLQKWLSAVEKSGGRIDVQPPPNDLVPKNPVALIGLLGSLMSSLQAIEQFSTERLFDAAKGRNVTVALDRNAAGDVIVTKVIFRKRS
jgi:hypothetical protein